MALGSCYTCIKYLMFAFNFIFWLLGCAILGVGIWLRVDESATDFIAHSDRLEFLYILAYVMMGIGLYMMIIGFLGCCGAIRESQCMLGLFFICLFITFAALLGFGIWAVVAKGSVQDITIDMLESGVKNYYDDDEKKFFMDLVQSNLHCCGATQGKEDYDSSQRPPDICNEYTKPCADPLYNWAKDKLIIGAGVSIGIAVVMILGMVFSLVLCCAVRDTVA